MGFPDYTQRPAWSAQSGSWDYRDPRTSLPMPWHLLRLRLLPRPSWSKSIALSRRTPTTHPSRERVCVPPFFKGLATILSWALQGGFQQVHSWASHPSAHVRNLRSVRKAAREWALCCIALSLWASLKCLANWASFARLEGVCQEKSNEKRN